VAPLVYKRNDKHKPWAFGEGPPRWFPDHDTPCPDDVSQSQAQSLLADSVEGRDAENPDKKARYAVDGQGRFFKAYPSVDEAGKECWHGFPVREELVKRQVPCRVLRQLRAAKKITGARYTRLLGDAK
jgi:hypothetical protein